MSLSISKHKMDNVSTPCVQTITRYNKFSKTYILMYLSIADYYHGYYRNHLKSPPGLQFFYTHLLDEGVNFKKVSATR